MLLAVTPQWPPRPPQLVRDHWSQWQQLHTSSSGTNISPESKGLQSSEHPHDPQANVVVSCAVFVSFAGGGGRESRPN